MAEMKVATQVLRQEHEAILRMLEVAEVAAEDLEHGRTVDPSLLQDIVEFFRLFADQCHHGKEEDLLFPLLEHKGMPREGGPTGVMLNEHDVGRSYVKSMAEAAHGLAAGRSEAGLQWAGAVRDYVHLLRQHIEKENNILFVMAERMLSEPEQEELARQFDQVEEERMGKDTHDRLHARMEELFKRLTAA